VPEGEALRRALAGRDAAIYVLDGCPPGCGPRLQAAGLVPVLSSVAQVEEWATLARSGPLLTAALHIDTGMHRLGVTLEEAEALATAPDRLRGLAVEVLVSHLACADEPEHPLNARQQAVFRKARRLFPEARGSFANSAGIFLGDDYLFEQVRPGISLYGGGPRGRTDSRLRAVATFEAPVLQVRSVGPGESIGYGASFVAERAMRVAVIAAGYADGILRAGSNKGFGAVNGRRCRYLGRVSMDLIAVEIGDLEIGPGARIQLLGPDVPIDEVADAAGAIAYELLTRIAPRGERRYLGAVGA
jgi:alanine racemase